MPLSLNLHVFTDPGALWTLTSGFLWRLCYTGFDWLNHWPLVIEFTSSASPLSMEGRGVTESSNSLITWLVPLTTSPILRCFQKSPHWHKLRCSWKGSVMNVKIFFCSSNLGNSKDFRSTVPEIGQSQICISYYKSQYHNSHGVLKSVLSLLYRRIIETIIEHRTLCRFFWN